MGFEDFSSPGFGTISAHALSILSSCFSCECCVLNSCLTSDLKMKLCG